jgi:hypothetical protein
MKSLITIILALIFAFPAFAADDPKATFVAFMKLAQSGQVNKAIKEYGIDNRDDKSWIDVKMPGKLSYEIKDVNEKKGGEAATIAAQIDYESITEGAKDTAGTVATAGKLATGNVVGAAGGMAKNKAGDSASSIHERTQVDMKRSGAEWKVVVTDRLYRLLTGEKR